jgi:hypothetical protein
MGFFYVVGCLYELHVHGGNPSFRTFVGGIPMLTSMNIAAQLRRVARLKNKLRDATVIAPEPETEPESQTQNDFHLRDGATAGSSSSHSNS